MLGFVYGSERAQRELVQLVREVYPSATTQETRIVRQLVEGRALSLGIGVVGTLFAVTALYGAIDRALAAVLGRTGKRPFLRGHVDAYLFAGAIALLAVLSFAVSVGTQAVQEALIAAGFGQQVRLLLEFGSPLLGLAAGYGFFYLVYRFVPRAPVGGGVARAAALVSALLWEVAKVAFGFFTRGLGVFQAYGPLAFAAGLLAWIYLTAVIILIGAEVIKTERGPSVMGTGRATSG